MRTCLWSSILCLCLHRARYNGELSKAKQSESVTSMGQTQCTGVSRFLEFLTIFPWTPRNWGFRRQEIVNSKNWFCNFSHFTCPLSLCIANLQHCDGYLSKPTTKHRLVEIEYLIVRGRKTTAHKPQKIWRSLKFCKYSGKWEHPGDVMCPPDYAPPPGKCSWRCEIDYSEIIYTWPFSAFFILN